MLYTLLEEDFSNWVRGIIEKRNKKMTTAHNLLIEMDPDVAAAFTASTAVSSKLQAFSEASFIF